MSLYIVLGCYCVNGHAVPSSDVIKLILNALKSQSKRTVGFVEFTNFLASVKLPRQLIFNRKLRRYVQKASRRLKCI